MNLTNEQIVNLIQLKDYGLFHNKDINNIVVAKLDYILEIESLYQKPIRQLTKETLIDCYALDEYMSPIGKINKIPLGRLGFIMIKTYQNSNFEIIIADE
jgi:hypothetical protein